jgi:hypothetical protein
VLLLLLIVCIFVGLITWYWLTAPNVSALPPPHKRSEVLGMTDTCRRGLPAIIGALFSLEKADAVCYQPTKN